MQPSQVTLLDPSLDLSRQASLSSKSVQSITKHSSNHIGSVKKQPTQWITDQLTLFCKLSVNSVRQPARWFRLPFIYPAQWVRQPMARQPARYTETRLTGKQASMTQQVKQVPLIQPGPATGSLKCNQPSQPNQLAESVALLTQPTQLSHSNHPIL